MLLHLSSLHNLNNSCVNHETAFKLNQSLHIQLFLCHFGSLLLHRRLGDQVKSQLLVLELRVNCHIFIVILKCRLIVLLKQYLHCWVGKLQ
jgi:hypothetical protein